MKCQACGYEDGYEGKDWIKLQKLIEDKGFGKEDTITVYACPKCGALKVNV